MAFISTNALSKPRSLLTADSDVRNPVEVADNSIVFTPNEMEMNRFYFVELNGAPYLYRRIDAGEVEIYGLAD